MGGNEDLGALGPDGTPEKQVNLQIALLLAERLRHRGAEVILTRTTDVDVGLAERVRLIQTQEPHLALSIHYNALPDAGDAWGYPRNWHLLVSPTKPSFSRIFASLLN
jgi:N-acetylmuramoyl-L-alanine amidase